MKKYLSIILLVAMLVMLTACSSTTGQTTSTTLDTAQQSTANIETTDSTSESTKVEVASAAGSAISLAVLKGPTGFVAADWLANSPSDIYPAVSAEVLKSPDLVAPLLARGEVDLAMVPTTMAVQLYKKTEGKVKFLAVTTKGVLHLCERGDSVHDITDLRGKTILLSGAGTTPEQILRRLLEAAGLDPDQDVNWQLLPEHAAVVQTLAQQADSVALLPEPFVTVAQTKLQDLRVAVDLNDAWAKYLHNAQGESGNIVMGVLVARSEWLEAHADVVEQVLEAVQHSQQTAVTKPAEVATEIGALDIFETQIAEKAIPRSGLASLIGEQGRQAVEDFLIALDDEKTPAPDADFYYLP